MSIKPLESSSPVVGVLQNKEITKKSKNLSNLFNAAWKEKISDGWTCVEQKNKYFYQGSIQDGKISGIGILLYREDSVDQFLYEGNFINGQSHDPEGKLHLGFGWKYTGHFENGRRHGPWKIETSDGIVYEGNFSGYYKRGYFSYELFQGAHKITYPDGLVYEADLSDFFSQAHEKVREKDPRWEGPWLLDDPQLEQRIFHINFQRKEFFRSLKKETLYLRDSFFKGICPEALSEKCERTPDSLERTSSEEGGSLTLFEGGVTFPYPDGRIYIGSFVDGKPHGDGFMKKEGEFEYEGKFADGLFHGYGKYTDLQTQNTYKGRFTKGEYIPGVWKRTSLSQLPSFNCH